MKKKIKNGGTILINYVINIYDSNNENYFIYSYSSSIDHSL